MSNKPDLLAGLNTNERRSRLRADAEFIVQSSKAMMTEEGVAVARAARIPIPRLWGREMPEAVISARVDLDTPLMLPDNLVVPCVDCDCDVQVRPDIPQGIDVLCIPCGARRMREAAA